LLFPLGLTDLGTDFKKFYFQNFRLLFLWAIISVGLSISDNLFISDLSLTDQPVQLLLFIFLMFILIRNYQLEWIHKVIVLFLSTLLLFSKISYEWVIGS